MADNETPEQPEETTPAADATAETAAVEAVPAPAPEIQYAATPAPQAPRLRDHVFSFRSVIAVAVATLLLGGAGGAALVAVTGDDNDQVRITRFGDRPDRDGNGPQFQYGDRGFAPPNAPEGGVQPDSGSNG